MKRFFVLITMLSVSGAVLAQIDEHNDPKLKSHEPVLLGYTFDSDDEAFLDFKISLQYPIADKKIKKYVVDRAFFPRFLKSICTNSVFDSCYPYFSFTGRFGQYIGTRDSSPVISKRFNPKVFLRFDLLEGEYIDLEYAHESNGQRISTKSSYDNLAADLEKPEYANDYISRGWDYWGITYKHAFLFSEATKVSTYLKLKNYVGGALQGEIEEYYVVDGSEGFEPEREIIEREDVGGFQVLHKWSNEDELFLSINKIALIYETGTREPAKYNTVTLELTTNSVGIPLMFWYRYGYNSDLAQYFKKVDSGGVAFELKTFQ